MVVPGIGKMRIDVIEAKLTRDVEVFGTMAPFVKISLLAQVFRTQANTGGGKLPKWNQVKNFVSFFQNFDFNITSPNDMIDFGIFDKTMTSNSEVRFPHF
jgi:hypothetical protein